MLRPVLSKDFLDTLCGIVQAAYGTSVEVMDFSESETKATVHLWIASTWTNIELSLLPQASVALGVTTIRVSRLLDPETCMSHDVTTRVSLEFHHTSDILEPWNLNTPIEDQLTHARVSHMLRIVDRLFDHYAEWHDQIDVYA